MESFAQDLNIPSDILKGLSKERGNEELKLFAQSIPDVLYPDTYILAGRLLLYLNIKACAHSIEEYVDALEFLLHEEQIKFLLENKDILNNVLQETYEYNYKFHDLVTANRIIDYCLKLDLGELMIETPCQLFLRLAVQFYRDEGIDKVLKVYYSLLDRKYIHASPTMFNAGKKKSQMSSCFAAGTKIFTKNRGIVNIEDVELGDIVTTHKGNDKPVTQLHKNLLNGRDLYKLKIFRTSDIKITANHKLYAIQSNSDKKPRWIPVEYLWPGDYVAIPPKNLDSKIYTINVLENIDKKYKIEHKNDDIISIKTVYSHKDHLNGTENYITRFKANSEIKHCWSADADWAFFLGAWYGDGNIMTGTREDITTNKGIRFVVHEDNYSLLEKLSEIGENKLGLKSKINKGTTYNSNLYYLDYHSGILGDYFYNNYGKGFSGKKLDKKMFNWGGKEIKGFIAGLFSTDGCWTKEGKQLIQLSNTSLMTEIYYLLRSHGVEVSKYFISKEGKKLATEDSILITLPNDYLTPDDICKYYTDGRLKKYKNKNGLSSRVKEVDGQRFLRLDKKILCEDKPEYVYTLGVEDDHSYTIEGIVAENCFLMTLGDNLESLLYDGCGDSGMISKLQGGLGINLSQIRHSAIEGGGTSEGVLPFGKNIDCIIKTVNQGATRNGAGNFSLIDWHMDIVDFIKTRDMTNNDGIKYERANVTFFVSSLFMNRVRNNQKWTLFCPKKAKMILYREGKEQEIKLLERHGPEFEEVYPLFEAEAERRMKKYLEFCEEIKIKEKYVNSNPDDDEERASYYSMVKEKIKLKKNLIEHKTIEAKYLYELVCEMQLKSSMPYVVYRDAINMKSNVANIGTVETSNLCLEICEVSTPEEIASCNLAHLNLKAFVKKEISPSLQEKYEKLSEEERFRILRECYDFKDLGETTEMVVENLNKVIDFNYYPLDERDKTGKVTKQGKISRPNFENRPLGIGVSGLSDVFALLDVSYDSPWAYLINKMIFACMYYSGMRESMRLSELHGEYKNFRTGKFKTFINDEFVEFNGSPLSNGFFQFDLWKHEADYLKSIGRLNTKLYNEEDNTPLNPSSWGEKGTWSTLRKLIIKNGVYNSLLFALMPTASSAQLVNNAETTEAHQTLIYSRKLFGGNFTFYSDSFVKDMMKYKLWCKELIDFVIICDGSIKYLKEFIRDFPDLFPNPPSSEILDKLIDKHKTMYEISQIHCIRMARQRAIYVCQSQSLNIYKKDATITEMKKVHNVTDAFRIKTGMYYLRQEPGSKTAKFTANPEIMKYYEGLVGKKERKSVLPSFMVQQEGCSSCE